MTSLLCETLGHDFGEWEYIADDSCKQTRTCKRDKHTDSREAPHKFGEWEYLADSLCDQVRSCKRCHFQDRRVEHEFDEWKYVDADRCDQVRSCQRCHFQDKRVEHREIIVEPGYWDAQVYHESFEYCACCGVPIG